MRTVLLAALFLLSSLPVPATTYYVNPEGTGDYPTIQAAIIAAQDYDIIMLTDGIFTGNGNRDVDFMGKGIMLRSEHFDPYLCTIDCQGSEGDPHRGFLLISGENEAASLNGITIRNGHVSGEDGYGGAIKLGEQARPFINNCVITNNQALLGGGLMAEDLAAPNISNCVFVDNEAVAGAAMAFRNTCSPVLSTCEIRANNAVWGGAVIYGGWEEQVGAGSKVEILPMISPECATVDLLAAPATPAPLSTLLIKFSTFFMNRITSNGAGGGLYYHGRPESWLNIGLSLFLGNGGGGDSERAGAIYFNGYTDHLSTISFATFARNDSGEEGEEGSCIRHAGGALLISSCVLALNETSPIACESGDGSAPTLTDCCDIFGNGTGNWSACIADQYGSGGNFAKDPRFCSPVGWDFRLDEQSPCVPENNECGYLIGAYYIGCSIPSISYFIKPDGTGDYPTIQAAIDAASDYDIVELADGTFTGTGNRDIQFNGKKLTIRSANGDPAACVIDCQGSEELPHRAFHFHESEGAESTLDGLTLTGGFVSGESGVGGAILCSDAASPTIRNCLIHSNCAVMGGGVGLYQGAAVIENCTIVDNHISSDQGAGVYCSASRVEIRRSIIAGNRGGTGIHADLFCPTLSCTDIHGNEGGDWIGDCIEEQQNLHGNFEKDPLFCNACAGDFTLAKSSPCLPGGNGCGVLVGALGQGCDHPTGLPAESELQARIILLQNHPNPFNPQTAIRFSLPEPEALRLTIHDVTGRCLRVLADGSHEAGEHCIVWDGRDEHGCELAGGVYLLRLEAGEFTRQRKMVLIR